EPNTIWKCPRWVSFGQRFSAVSTAVGLKIAGHEFFELINLFLMPIFFVSGAIIPVEAMPEWLQVIARFNPLAYSVDAIRKLMLGGELGLLGGEFAMMDILPSLLFDASVLLLFLSVSVLISVILARKALI
ncbi:MAG: ABC transporter permease, partial [Candidatus Jordarchaeum sp.]|uniref:ABC transporter permease n=1 Tax=Candidatus Jordarchaeum sp. TaxID=2823881 RepID=UPI00404BA312